MNPHDFGDPLTFPLVQLAGWHLDSHEGVCHDTLVYDQIPAKLSIILQLYFVFCSNDQILVKMINVVNVIPAKHRCFSIVILSIVLTAKLLLDQTISQYRCDNRKINLSHLLSKKCYIFAGPSFTNVMICYFFSVSYHCILSIFGF